MPAGLSANEEAQLLQTVEMFEVITQSQPLDYQSLEILKEAYFKLKRHKEVINTSKRIAQAYVQMGQLSLAMLEYESVLQLIPDDPELKKALAEIEDRTHSLAEPAPGPEKDKDPGDKSKSVSSKNGPPGTRPIQPMVDDGRKAMQKIFVEGKYLSEADFNQYWVTPSLEEVPSHPVPPFIQTVAGKGIVSLETSLKLLCEKSRAGYLPLEKYDVDIELARRFPKDVCRRWCILPFDRMSKAVLVGTANPFNKQAIRDLEKSSQQRFLWYIMSPLELTESIRRIYR